MLLSNNRNSFGLCDWLEKKEGFVYYYSGRITKQQILCLNPSLIVSYNYSYIIPSEIIHLVSGRIINLHISLLPWNRGADPNFWSFFDDTPKGVTIHNLSAGLDTGEILLQRELFFDEERETLRSTYQVLNDTIVELLKENWERVKANEIIAMPQQGNGSYHKRSDMIKLLHGITLNMDRNIHDLKSELSEK